MRYTRSMSNILDASFRNSPISTFSPLTLTFPCCILSSPLWFPTSLVPSNFRPSLSSSSFLPFSSRKEFIVVAYTKDIYRNLLCLEINNQTQLNCGIPLLPTCKHVSAFLFHYILYVFPFICDTPCLSHFASHSASRKSVHLLPFPCTLLFPFVSHPSV